MSKKRESKGNKGNMSKILEQYIGNAASIEDEEIDETQEAPEEEEADELDKDVEKILKESEKDFKQEVSDMGNTSFIPEAVDTSSETPKAAAPELNVPKFLQDIAHPEAKDESADAEKSEPTQATTEGRKVQEPVDKQLPIPVEEENLIEGIVLRNDEIAEDKEEKMINVDIVDLRVLYKEKDIVSQAAQLHASNGELLSETLGNLLMLAVENNHEIRKVISHMIPDLIHEFPDGLSDYRKAINEVASDHHVKYMIRCERNNKLYEDMELAYADLDKDALVALNKGEWKFADAWVRTDNDGNITNVLSKPQVLAIISALPKEVQAQAYTDLHLTQPEGKEKKSSKKPSDSKKD